MLEPLFNSAAGLQGGGGGPFKPVTLLKETLTQVLFCYQCQIFKTVIYSIGHETTYFAKYLRTGASENLCNASILIFRRYFRSSSLSVFWKVSVLKTSVKFLGKHIRWSLFSIHLQTLSLKFY